MRRCAAATRRTASACDRHRAVETIRVSLLRPPSPIRERAPAFAPKPISSLPVSTLPLPLSLYRSPSFAASDDNRILSERSRASYLPAHLLLSPREEPTTIAAEDFGRAILLFPSSEVPCTHVCARAGFRGFSQGDAWRGGAAGEHDDGPC